MSDLREYVSIGDDGTMDTVVDYDGRFGTTQCRYNSEYRFSFDNDSAFLDAVAEEVEDIARFEARAWPYHNDGKERGGWRSVYLKEEEVS